MHSELHKAEHITLNRFNTTEKKQLKVCLLFQFIYRKFLQTCIMYIKNNAPA